MLLTLGRFTASSGKPMVIFKIIMYQSLSTSSFIKFVILPASATSVDIATASWLVNC